MPSKPNSSHVQALLKSMQERVEAGDLGGLRDAVTFLDGLAVKTPDWVSAAVIKLIGETVSKNKVLGKGTLGNAQRKAQRDWIDLRRWLAVEHGLRQLHAAGHETPMAKQARYCASDILKDTDAKAQPSRIGASWRRLEQLRAKNPLAITGSWAPSEEELDEFMDMLQQVSLQKS